MTKLVRHHPGFFGIALLALALPLVWRLAWPARAAAMPLLAPDTASTLIRSGLDPDALAAAGVSSSQVASVVAAFEAAVAAEPGKLPSADADYGASKTSTDSLRRTIESGQGSPQDVTAYQSGMSTLQAAETARQDTLDEYFTAATAGLNAAQRLALSTIRSNRAWEISIEFKAQDRSEAEWVALRDALSNERISAKYGDPPDPKQQALLLTARSAPAVAAAKVNYDTNKASVSSAWNTATQ
jgi:hypothetical protein